MTGVQTCALPIFDQHKIASHGLDFYVSRAALSAVLRIKTRDLLHRFAGWFEMQASMIVRFATNMTDPYLGMKTAPTHCSVQTLAK